MINIFELEPPTRIRLKSGVVAEVVENGKDGQWIEVRYLSGPDASLAGSEQLCHADEIVEVLPGPDGE